MTKSGSGTDSGFTSRPSSATITPRTPEDERFLNHFNTMAAQLDNPETYSSTREELLHYPSIGTSLFSDISEQITALSKRPLT